MRIPAITLLLLATAFAIPPADAQATVALPVNGPLSEFVCELNHDLMPCIPQEGACGMVSQPGCWTARYVCYWIGLQLEKVTGKECTLQPGCCNQTGSNGTETILLPVPALEARSLAISPAIQAPDVAIGNGALEALEPALNAPCEVFGVEVNLVLFSTTCTESCANYGVEVNVIVLGTRCSGVSCVNQGLSVSVGDNCGRGLASVCADAICVPPTHPCKGCVDPFPPELPSVTTSPLVAVAAFQPADCIPDQIVHCQCDYDAPAVWVGIVECPNQGCSTSSVYVLVGMQECKSCGGFGTAVYVGHYCEENGVGFCVNEHCARILSGQDYGNATRDVPSLTTVRTSLAMPSVADFGPDCIPDQVVECQCDVDSPTVWVGMVECHEDCHHSSLYVLVGMQECHGACYGLGLTVFVGGYCGERGVGYCFHEHCTLLLEGGNGTAVPTMLAPAAPTTLGRWA